MDGGVSHALDPKPRLRAEHGKPFGLKIDATQFDAIGRCSGAPEFNLAGNWTGQRASRTSARRRRLCVIRSMNDFPEHARATLMMHCGHPLQGRPCVGPRLSYGLGSTNANLPAYAVVSGGMVPIGGVENFSNGFLPPRTQGVDLRCA